MAIVNPGEKLPATYLERFDPAENVTYRFSVLSTSAIATESHWVDVPSKNVKGVYQCIQGMCCHAMGRRTQTYSVPIYVYRRADSAEGDIYVLQMTPARWKKFSDMALNIDLLQYDLIFSAQRRGQGMDWSYTAEPSVKFRDYWTADQKQQLEIATQSFYQMGESSLVNPMSFNEWGQLLYDIGYDVQNQCWPGGQSPMNAGNAFGAIGRAVGTGSMLPPPPPAGFVPSHPQVPNIAGNGVILQPTPLTPPVASVPITSTPVQGSFQSHSASIPSPAGSPVQGAIPQGHAFPTMSPPSVPLGTAPVIPQQTVSQQPVSQGVPQQQVVQNSVQTGVQEITAEELNKMLTD